MAGVVDRYEFAGTMGPQNIYGCMDCGSLVLEDWRRGHDKHHEDVEALKTHYLSLVDLVAGDEG